MSNLATVSALLDPLEMIIGDLERDPTRAYTPLPHQAEFHLSPALARALIMGNQSAKSHSAAMEVVWTARGNWPEWVLSGRDVPIRRARTNQSGDPNRRANANRVLPARDHVIIYEDWSDRCARRRVPERPTKTRIMVPKFDTSSGIVDKIMDFLPPGTFKAYRNAARVYAYWEVECLYGGISVIELVSDQGTELSGEGWVGDLYVMDEPTSRARYIAHQRGLITRDGRTVMALTPLKGSAWIKDDIVDASLTDPEIACWSEIDSWVNCDENGGFISRKRLNHFFKRNVKSRAERLAREHGKFLHLSGRAFDFKKDVHVVRPNPPTTEVMTSPIREVVGRFGNEQWWNDALHFEVYDPHPRRAPVILFGCIGFDNRILIYDEYPRVWPSGDPYLYREVDSDPHTAAKLAAAERIIRSRWAGEVAWRWVDPRGGAQEIDGNSWITLLSNEGIPLTPAPVSRRKEGSEIEEGIHGLAEWLAWNESEPLQPGNQPTLGICEHCHNTIWAFDNWGYVTEEIGNDRMATETKLMETGKDHIDCARYVYFGSPAWFDWRLQALVAAREELESGAVGDRVTGY